MCLFCGKTFQNYKKFFNHSRKPLYNPNLKLKQHMCCHSDEKFMSQTCEKEFKHERNYICHMKGHSVEIFKL